MMKLENKKDAPEVTIEVEHIEKTPFTLVNKNDGEGWFITIGKTIISDKRFDELSDGIIYCSRMDTIDVINALVLIISTKDNE